MATTKKVEKTETVETKKATNKKTVKKEVKAEVAPTKKDTKKVEKTEKSISKAILHDFEIILEPIITEKSMAVVEGNQKYSFKVKKGSNKTEIRKAIERIYGVHVVGISTLNKVAKKTTRGSRYSGTISGYKKAVVTLKTGETINLFKD